MSVFKISLVGLEGKEKVDGGRFGRIVRSRSALTGELAQALARHSLLAASLPETLPADPDPEALKAVVRLAVRDGLGRAAFLVWIAAMDDDDAEQTSEAVNFSSNVH